jgi:hypothetical protein
MPEHADDIGMFCFVSDSPTGPFRPQRRAYRMLVTNGTYFTRFYRTPDELLVNHHSVEHDGNLLRRRPGHVFFAPLKKAVVDDDAIMRLAYWPGNEALKGEEIPIDLGLSERVFPEVNPGEWSTKRSRLEANEPYAGGYALFGERFDAGAGVVLEADLAVEPGRAPWAGIGFYIEHDHPDRNATAILAQTRGRTDVGTVFRPEKGFF